MATMLQVEDSTWKRLNKMKKVSSDTFNNLIVMLLDDHDLLEASKDD